MHDKNFLRGIYIIIFILILAGSVEVITIKKSIAHLTLLIQKQRALPTFKKITANIKNATILSKQQVQQNILTLVAMSGLSMEFIAMNKNTENLNHDFDAYNIDLSAQGNIEQIKNFFKMLSQQCLIYFVYDTDLSKARQLFNLRFKFSMFNYCRRKEKLKNLRYVDFMSSQNLFKNNFKNYSITQIKFAGFIKSLNHLSAIVLLPDRESKEVRLGDILGREQTRVVYIDKKTVGVEANKTIFFIKK